MKKYSRKILNDRAIIVILIASFASYFLSFPLFGPLSELVPKNLKDTYYTFYLLFHFVGIAITAFTIDVISKRVRVLKFLAALLILATLLFYVGKYIVASIIQGIAMGAQMVVWGSIISTAVKPWERAKTFSIAAAIANVFLLIIQYTGNKNLLLAITFLIPVFLLSEVKIVKNVQSWKINRNVISFAIPVIVFYVLGGIMYAYMEPKFKQSGINTHVLFYVFAILIAGYLYDKFERKNVTVFGLLLLALAYVLFSRSMLVSSYLIQSSYGFIDVFSMIIWADLSYYGSEGKHYGIGVSIVVASLLIGYKLARFYLNPHDLESIALILLLVASIFTSIVKDPTLSEKEYAIRAAKIGGVMK